MMLLQDWFVLETIGIILVFALILAWVIPEAVHCDGPVHRPEEYAERMVEFFDTSFGMTR